MLDYIICIDSFSRKKYDNFYFYLNKNFVKYIKLKKERKMPNFDNFPIIASLIAGIFTFVSPCVLPLIPAYITLVTGLSLNQLSEKNNFLKIFLSSLIFVLGFTTIFVLLGISATYIGSFFLDNINILRWIGGIIVIIFGLHLTGIFKISFFYKQTSFFKPFEKSNNYLTVFFIGCAFALGWTPCVGPVLSSILVLASTQETLNKGAFLLIFYSLGLGIPFILTALFINRFLIVFNFIKKYYRIIEIVSGILLIIIGIILITNNFNKLTMLLI